MEIYRERLEKGRKVTYLVMSDPLLTRLKYELGNPRKVVSLTSKVEEFMGMKVIPLDDDALILRIG